MPHELLFSTEQILKSFIQKGQTVIIGVSGGPDSMCLLNIILKLRKKWKIKIIGAHLNHQLRGKESDEDKHFVEIFAKKNALPLEIKRVVIKKNLEEQGRKERYKFFQELKKKYKADWILVAHNKNDNTETMLLNLIRGAGVSGLKGMEIKNGPILRPLLKTSKEEILDWLKKEKISYRIDSSNLNKKFARNFIRLEIIPLLKNLNPAIQSTLGRERQHFQKIHKFFKEETEKWIKKYAKHEKNEWKFSGKKFCTLPDIVQEEILKNFYEKCHGSSQNLKQDTIERAKTLIEKGKTGKKTAFGKYWLEVQYKKIIIRELSKKLPKKALTKLKIPGTTRFGKGKIKTTIVKNWQPQTKTIFLDFDRTKQLWVRNWKPGDVIKPLGLKGHKKLQDIFVDKKIPREKRKFIPILVTKKDQIIAVGHYTIDENFRVSRQNKNFLKVKFIN